MNEIVTKSGWRVKVLEDDDNHLNIYIENEDETTIHDIDTGQGDGTEGEQLALRFTTDDIERAYREGEPIG
jgi:hypothetical protein